MVIGLCLNIAGAPGWNGNRRGAQVTDSTFKGGPQSTSAAVRAAFRARVTKTFRASRDEFAKSRTGGLAARWQNHPAARTQQVSRRSVRLPRRSPPRSDPCHVLSQRIDGGLPFRLMHLLGNSFVRDDARVMLRHRDEDKNPRTVSRMSPRRRDRRRARRPRYRRSRARICA
jgi:hypothetical protein